MCTKSGRFRAFRGEWTGRVVDALVEIERAAAVIEADRIVQMAAAMRIAQAREAHQPVAVRRREMEERSIAAEIGVATRTKDRAVQNRMHAALTLCEDFRATLDALADGAISARHATVIREAGANLHDPGPLVHGIVDRLTRQGKATKAVAVPTRSGDVDDGVVHDTRTLDQIRADLACDMLLSGAPAIDPTLDDTPGGLGAIRAHVSITVPVLTAAGVDDRGALLDGTIPVDADTARRMMAGAPGWERILTHPITGQVQAVDTYRRPKALQRFLEARDVHCRFPGCRQPARRCDHDHNHDWAHGGATRAGNLACLCKRHHTLKTEKPWKAHQLRDGTIRWSSPLGRTAVDRPRGTSRSAPTPVPRRSDPPDGEDSGGGVRRVPPRWACPRSRTG